MSEYDGDTGSESPANLYQRAAAAATGAMLGSAIPGPVGLVTGAFLGVALERLAGKSVG